MTKNAEKSLMCFLSGTSPEIFIILCRSSFIYWVKISFFFVFFAKQVQVDVSDSFLPQKCTRCINGCSSSTIGMITKKETSLSGMVWQFTVCFESIFGVHWNHWLINHTPRRISRCFLRNCDNKLHAKRKISHLLYCSITLRLMLEHI